MTFTNWIDYPQSSPRRSYKRQNSTSAVMEYLIHSLLIMEHNLLLRHSGHLQRNTSSSTSLPPLIGPSLMAEWKQRSAKHILLTAEDADLTLLSVRNTPPAGHTYSPAQRLFGRTLRTDLPQSSATLEPCTTHRDTVILEHLHQKSRQKKAYDKHAGNYPQGLMCMPSHLQPHRLRLGSLER